MCRTLGLKYQCHHQIDARLSTCRGAHGTRDAFRQTGNDFKKNRVMCTSAAYLVMHQPRRCGSCEVKHLTAGKRQQKDTCMTEAKLARDRWFGLVAAEKSEEEIAAAMGEFEEAERMGEGLSGEIVSLEMRLERMFPVFREGKFVLGPTKARSRKLDRGSLLREEVRREDVFEGLDSALDAERYRSALDTYAENTFGLDNAWEESSGSGQRCVDEPDWVQCQDAGREDFGWSGTASGCYHQVANNPLVLDDQDFKSWYGTSEPELDEHQWSRDLSPVWEMSDESSLSSKSSQDYTQDECLEPDIPLHIDTSNDDNPPTPEINSLISFSSDVKSVTSYATQSHGISSSLQREDPAMVNVYHEVSSPTEAAEKRPHTPQEKVTLPPEGFTFRSPIKHLASTLRIPSGLVQPLRLLGHFSFERPPPCNPTVPAIPISTSSRQHGGNGSAVDSLSRPTAESTLAPSEDVDPAEDLVSPTQRSASPSATTAADGAAVPELDGPVSSSSDHMSQTTTALNPSRQQRRRANISMRCGVTPIDYLSVAYWNWRQSGTWEHWLDSQ